MLSINGLHNFYYLPELHDMRCKAQRICEIIRGRYHRDPLNGDVYMFMSKDQRKVRMIHYERNAYYLPELHDMRCKAQRICEIIRGRYHRDPLNGDVYMFMSKDQRKVRMIHYERNAYYLHEKSFIKGYKFMKIERKDDVTVYKIDWKDLVTILETPAITSIRI